VWQSWKQKHKQKPVVQENQEVQDSRVAEHPAAQSEQVTGKLVNGLWCI